MRNCIEAKRPEDKLGLEGVIMNHWEAYKCTEANV